MKLSKYVADVRHIVRTNAVLLRRAAMICLVLTLVVQASVFAFSRAYQIGYSPQTDLSLPWRFLLVEKRAPEQHVIQRGEIVQFSLPAAARAFKVTAEVFPPQVSFTKIVAGEVDAGKGLLMALMSFWTSPPAAQLLAKRRSAVGKTTVISGLGYSHSRADNSSCDRRSAL